MDTPTPGTPTSPPARASRLPDVRSLSLLDHVTSTVRLAPPATPNYYYSNRQLSDFPPELIAIIMHHLYYSIIAPPAHYPSPDPALYLIPAVSLYSSPTFIPTPSEQARSTFLQISLVDKTWGEEGRKLLWRNVSIGMPRAFESILRTIEEYKTGRRDRKLLATRKRETSAETEWGRSLTPTGTIKRAASTKEATRGRAIDLDWISTGEANWSKMGGDDNDLQLRGASRQPDGELCRLLLKMHDNLTQNHRIGQFNVVDIGSPRFASATH